jgi:hypothetical protein
LFLHFFKITEVAQSLGLHFLQKKVSTNWFWQKWFGLHFGRLFSEKHPVTLTEIEERANTKQWVKVAKEAEKGQTTG